MKFVGITGSIGCGKTTLSHIVRDLGYNVYDIDAWVRRMYYDGDFINLIDKNFPEVIESNRVNKRKLRNIVFDDNVQLKKLEDLIHPFLDKKLKEKVRKQARKKFINFVDVALLFEMSWEKFFDLIVVTHVDYDTQKKRVMERDRVSAEHFDKINNVQMCNNEKMKQSDIVIETDVRMNLLRLEAIKLIEYLECGLYI